MDYGVKFYDFKILELGTDMRKFQKKPKYRKIG